MDSDWLARAGVGVVLGWATLPLLARLARRGRSLPPRSYHRALVLALGLSLALTLVPALRAFFDTRFPPRAAGVLLSLDSVRVAAEWAAPLVEASQLALPESLWSRVASAITLVWLGAVVLGASGLDLAHRRTRRLVARATAAPEAVRQRAAELARLRGIAAPRVVVSAECAAPLTAGLVDCVIVLAPSNLTDDAAALDFVLRHELEHVARRDTSTALALRCALLAFAGHPSARALARELAFAREACVDAIAGAEAPLEYARFLVSSAERLSRSRHVSLAALSMHDTALTRRIDMLVSPPSPSPSARRPALLVAAMGSALCGATFCSPVAWSDDPIASSPVDEQVAVSGRLAPELIQEVVRSRHADFRRCYEQEVPEPRAVTGVDMHFVIGADGSVSSGHVDSQPYVELGACAERVMLSLRFPPPEGGSVSVAYPLEFAPAGGSAPAGTGALAMKLPTDPTAQGLPPDVIRKVVRDSFPQFRECYEQLPQPRPTLTLKMHFTIGSSGRVVDGHVDAEASPALGSCVEASMRRMVFPGPTHGDVTVGYPIAFAPG